MSRVFWDTNLYIYLTEGRSALAHQVETLRGKMRARGDELLTSTLTLGEVLVKPLALHDHRLAATYRSGITEFTNDARLYSKQVPGIQFIVPLDRVPI